MSRYIDADKLTSHLKDEIENITQPFGGRSHGKGIAYGTELGLKMAISYTETLPTADVVEVRHARWLSAYEYAIKIGVKDEERLAEVKKDKLWKFCPLCEQSVKWDYDFCPNCGAKMDAERREE